MSVDIEYPITCPACGSCQVVIESACGYPDFSSTLRCELCGHYWLSSDGDGEEVGVC